MVESDFLTDLADFKADIIDLPQEELNWSSVSLKDVINQDLRLEASLFDIEGKHAREVLSKCKWDIIPLAGEHGLIEAYHRPRFKRIWVENSKYPIFQPGQITEINPQPSGYLSDLTETDIEALRVKNGQILLTCSGTIGRSTVVSETLNNKIFSHDLIRINCKENEFFGYIYAFLQTKIGKVLMHTNSYGAVISHIEPEHLENIPIPNPSKLLKQQIHELIKMSFSLRDESNQLLEKAEILLINELNLPALSELRKNSMSEEVNSFSTKLSELNNRLEGSHHLPAVKVLLQHLLENASYVRKIGDSEISKSVELPGRFKRVYVEEGQGKVFFGGKQILNLDPTTEKYLSTGQHSERIKEQLVLQKNTILISRSGTIGKLALVPQHWEGWTASEDLIRIFPANEGIAGYLFSFLNSKYGQILMKRFVYGSVQDHIEDIHVSQIEIPILKNKEVQTSINSMVLEANEKRYQAYKLEQKAIKMVNQKVIHAERD